MDMDAPLATPAPRNELERELQSMIDMRGPMTVAEYMRQVLSHPTLGYYMQRDVFGKAGDFTTAPEISQMFGELIAVWLVSQWQSLGRPARIRLVEIGPGRGTLMADMLRALACFGPMKDAIVGVHMIEMSSALRKIQRKTLDCTEKMVGDASGEGTDADIREKLGLPEKSKESNLTGEETGGEGEIDDDAWRSSNGTEIRWHGSLEQVPTTEPIFMVGQELLDVLIDCTTIHSLHTLYRLDRSCWMRCRSTNSRRRRTAGGRGWLLRTLFL
jgi:SAM-dependent MidA family methyltransferase